MSVSTDNCTDSIDYDFDCGLFDDDFLAGDDAMLLGDFEIIEPEAAAKKSSVTGVVKSSKGWEVGAKVRRKALRRRGEIDNNAAVNSVLCRQGVGKRNNASAYKLYVFPTFDPSDALLFLPSTFATYFNSANTIELSKLMLSHVTKNCELNVHVLSDDNISTTTFFKFYDLISQLNPDSIMCVHSTKVEENQIRASIYIKYTACKAIYDSMSRMEKDPIFAPMFTVRDASMKRGISRADIPESERSEFFARMQTDLDLLVYIKAEMTLTIDDSTKKVSRFALKGRITSIEPVEESISQEEEKRNLVM